MKRPGLVAGALLAAAMTANGIRGQEVRREVQVPLDPARAIVEVSAELRRDLGLFPDVAGFVAARLFRTDDGREILEVSRTEDGRLVRERRTLTEADLLELRGLIASRMAEGGAARVGDREGRGGLVLAETALGLAYYGWAVPLALNVQATRGRVAAYLLTAGASFLVPYELTRSIPVSQAHRDAMVWGGTRGILYGALAGDALTGGADEEAVHDPSFPAEDDDTDRRAVLGLGVLGSIAGQLLAYRAVSAAGADRGTVALWSTVGDLSLAYGFGLSFVGGLYDGETRCDGDICSTSEFERTPAGHMGTMALGLAGLWVARRWSETERYTVGDARALLSAGILGGQVALPLGWAAFEDEDGTAGGKAFVATLVAGSVGGLLVGNRVLRDYALTPSEGLLVQAGHAAGGLLALGLTYLADSGPRADELVYMSTSTVGSLVGAFLTFRAVSMGSGAGAPRSPRPDVGGGPTVEVSALGAVPLLLRAPKEPGRPDGAGGPALRLPLLTVRW